MTFSAEEEWKRLKREILYRLGLKSSLTPRTGSGTDLTRSLDRPIRRMVALMTPGSPAWKTIERARLIAMAAHSGQKRKYTGAPYWQHPMRVALRVAKCPTVLDADVIAAAWLHDVLEDTPLVVEDLRNLFSDRVVRLVLEVTDVSRPEDGNREARKRIDAEHLALASSYGVTIKLADLLDNTRSIVRHDPAFAKVYLREKHVLLDVMRGGDPGLRAEVKRQLASWLEEHDD